jgi:small-conductance mechanosensitive channel
MALIMPIIKPLNDIFNNDYMFAVFAFLGAYVLNPAFPDIYAFFTFVRNKNIDLEKFISFYDNGNLVKGRIIQMTTSHVILKDHVRGVTLTVPNMNLHNKVINNLGDINEYLGLKRVLTYVVDFDSYNIDKGIKLKTIFKEILCKFQNKTSLISKQEQYNVWLSSHDYGIKITLWYFIKDIEQEEKIKLDLEDFILYEATKAGIDLRTPQLIELSGTIKK